MKLKHAQHLYNRAGFGMSLDDLQNLPRGPISRLVNKIFRDSKGYDDIQQVSGELLTLPRRLNKEEKRAFRKANKESVRDLNHAWLSQMAQSKAFLREKMTLFWHDHFACQVRNGFLVEMQNNTLRKYALGHFGDLLFAVAKDPAMLQFLNNQQNRKAQPNENFARELLELFTLGRGHYTEKDIQEAARAFTGWGFNKEGAYVFRKNQHDFGEKTFMGHTGDFNGDDIIAIVLANPQTARYLTEKIYRFFVSPVLDEEKVSEWSQAFYKSNYDIAKLMETIFTSEHFYSEEVIGSRIKSPVEYLAGLMRQLDLEFTQKESAFFIQRALGQVLFFPPNVAGWPENRAWIDSTTLLARLRIPQALIVADYQFGMGLMENFAGKEGLDLLGGDKKPIGKKIRADIDWKTLQQATKGLSLSESYDLLETLFLIVPLRMEKEKLLDFVKGKDPKTQLKMLCMRMLGTPEYQVC